MKNLFVFAALICIFVSAAFAQQSKTDARRESPNFTGITLDGKTIDSAALKGKILVLNLWFVNCPNCIQEIKLLNEIVEAYKDNKDVVFVGLATNTKPELEKFLIKNPFKYQIIPSAGTFTLFKFGEARKDGKMYLGYPVHVVVDREGKIALQIEGVKGVEAVKEELKKQLEKKDAKETKTK
jgi:peroxiredoxin